MVERGFRTTVACTNLQVKELVKILLDRYLFLKFNNNAEFIITATKTSALISKSYMSPSAVPLTIGIPQRIIANHAASILKLPICKKLITNDSDQNLLSQEGFFLYY